MHQFRLHLKQFFFIGLTVLLLIIIGLAGKQMGYEGIIVFLKGHESIGIAVYVGYCLLSTIIIALPVVPVWPVALFLYGFWPAVFWSLAGILIGASISFFLARKYGKKLVLRMIGKRIFNEIEHLVHADNPKTFLLIRLLGNNYFDTVSYMAGLSKLTYKTYIVITGISSFLWLIVMIYLIQKLGVLQNIQSFLTVMGLYGLVILVGALAWEIYHKRHKGRGKKRL